MLFKILIDKFQRQLMTCEPPGGAWEYLLIQKHQCFSRFSCRIPSHSLPFCSFLLVFRSFLIIFQSKTPMFFTSIMTDSASNSLAFYVFFIAFQIGIDRQHQCFYIMLYRILRRIHWGLHHADTRNRANRTHVSPLLILAVTLILTGSADSAIAVPAVNRNRIP